MSKPSTDATSDDEFQDALSDMTKTVPQVSTCKTKSNDESINALVDKQLGMALNDDQEQEATAAEEIEASEDQEGNNVAEYLEEDIGEDELREREKLLTPEELENNKEKADKMKLEGNELFKNGDAEQAIEIYSEALKICPTTYTKERAVLYGNRAAAKIKLEHKKSALVDCSQAITLWPDYVRVRIRRAKLYECEDKLDLALDDYKHVYELDRGQNEARAACLRLTPIVQERQEQMKEEMISKLKDLGNMILKPFGLSTANFQMQQDPNTGSYSINFNQNQNSS